MLTHRLVLLIGCLCLLAVRISFASPEPAASLQSALQAAGGQLMEISIHSWTELTDGFLSDEQLMPVVKQVMDRLAVPAGRYRITQVQDWRQHVVKAEITDGAQQLVVIAEMVRLPGSTPNGSPWRGYLIINTTNKENSRQAEEYNRKATAILLDFGKGPRINTCLVGYLDGKLVKDEWLERIQKAFTAVHATIDPVMSDENVVSCTGYTRAIGDYVTSQGKRINLNMAIRYSETENRTYMIIGSPVITREY